MTLGGTVVKVAPVSGARFGFQRVEPARQAALTPGGRVTVERAPIRLAVEGPNGLSNGRLRGLQRTLAKQVIALAKLSPQSAAP